MDFVLVGPKAGKDVARCELLRNWEQKYKLREGVPLGAELPAEAGFQMSADYPKATQLVDVLYTLERVLVVNARTRALLSERAAADVEFLPVRVADHAGKPIDTSYFIVNLLRAIDCIDKTATTFELNSLDPEQLIDVANLTIDEARIDSGVQIFRPTGLSKVMVARRELAEQLKAAGVAGLKISEVEEYED